MVAGKVNPLWLGVCLVSHVHFSRLVPLRALLGFIL